MMDSQSIRYKVVPSTDDFGYGTYCVKDLWTGRALRDLLDLEEAEELAEKLNKHLRKLKEEQ